MWLIHKELHCHWLYHVMWILCYSLLLLCIVVGSCSKVRFITAKAQTFVMSTTRPTASTNQPRLTNGFDISTTLTTLVRWAARCFPYLLLLFCRFVARYTSLYLTSLPPLPSPIAKFISMYSKTLIQWDNEVSLVFWTCFDSHSYWFKI